MSLIDSIVAHYKEHSAQSVEVPEWNVAIHFELLTIKRRSDLVKRCKDDVDVLVEMALDADGRKMFSAEDKAKLRIAADAEIVSRVAKAMLRLNTSVEDEIKN